MSDARVLVTGGSGFIGTNLVHEYKSAGIVVTNLDVAPPRNPADRDAWTSADLTRPEELVDVFRTCRPTHVIHLGARTDLDGRSVEDYSANVRGVENPSGRSARGRGAGRPRGRRLVAAGLPAGLRAALRRGLLPDDRVRSQQGRNRAHRARDHRSALVLVRPTPIWGLWFGVPYRDFFLNVVRGRYVHPAGRRIEKSFGYVGNTTWQLRRVMTAHPADVLGRTFYLGDDPPIDCTTWQHASARQWDVGRRGRFPCPYCR